MHVRPFDGMTLTLDDWLTDQRHHRSALARFARAWGGSGVIDGLGVALSDGRAVIGSGSGLALSGALIVLNDAAAVEFAEVPEGRHGLWLTLEERVLAEPTSPVWDGPERAPTRVDDVVVPALLPDGERHPDGVLVAVLHMGADRGLAVHRDVPRASDRSRSGRSSQQEVVARVVAALVGWLDAGATSVAMDPGRAALAASTFGAMELRLAEGGFDERPLAEAALRVVRRAGGLAGPSAPPTMARALSKLAALDAKAPGPNASRGAWLAWFDALKGLVGDLEAASVELGTSRRVQR